MPFLLGVVFVAARLGRGPAICASIATVLLFNFFFTPPFHTLAVSDTKYLFTFAVMLVIAVIISTLTSRIRDQVGLSRQRERRTEALYRLSRRLASTSGSHQLVAAAEAQLSEIFGGDVVIFLPDSLSYVVVETSPKVLPKWLAPCGSTSAASWREPAPTRCQMPRRCIFPW
jgi:two-component system sensor histidine kinase KdpD